MAKGQSKTVGVVGLYKDVNALIGAAEAVRDSGYRKWDCHTPYPVHGLDRAMGVKPSPVPYVTLTAGFVGLAGAIALTGWISVFQYPARVGGKARCGWRAFVPIYFELFVLFAALATMASVLLFCKLGRWHSPLHDSDVMRHITCDQFAIVLDAKDDQYSEDQTPEILKATGCTDVRPLLEHEEDGAFI